MKNYNLSPKIVGATDPIPPGLDPAIAKLAVDPVNAGNLSEAERQSSFDKAITLAGEDAMYNRKVVEKDGEQYWAFEYPNVFTFNGELRGKFDLVNKDPTKRDAAQQTSSMRSTQLEGKLSDVIIETEDGEQVIIRKRNRAVSSQLQEFDIVSTVMVAEAARKGEQPAPREIHSSVLDGVVLVPGLPMKLAIDPNTKDLPWTNSKITRITGLQLTEEGEVKAGHPDLKKPEKKTDARERFNKAIRAKRSTTLGSTAVRN